MEMVPDGGTTYEPAAVPTPVPLTVTAVIVAPLAVITTSAGNAFTLAAVTVVAGTAGATRGIALGGAIAIIVIVPVSTSTFTHWPVLLGAGTVVAGTAGVTTVMASPQLPRAAWPTSSWPGTYARRLAAPIACQSRYAPPSALFELA